MSSGSDPVRANELSAEWRRFRRALLFFVVCLAVVVGMFLVGSYH